MAGVTDTPFAGTLPNAQLVSNFQFPAAHVTPRFRSICAAIRFTPCSYPIDITRLTHGYAHIDGAVHHAIPRLLDRPVTELLHPTKLSSPQLGMYVLYSTSPVSNYVRTFVLRKVAKTPGSEP